jgi:hypothetical protein
MADDLRITADNLRERMEAGEHFPVIDTRNPHAWGEAADMAAGAIRFHGDEVNEVLPPRGHVLHVTERGLPRQSGAKTAGTWISRLGVEGWLRCMEASRAAGREKKESGRAP